MPGTGRIYRRGTIYYIAYRWAGREYRESARSARAEEAHRLLAQRLRERQTADAAPGLTFDDLAARYLEDYALHRYRTLTTARPRVAHLRGFFGGWPVDTLTAEAVRQYQRYRRGQRAEAATINRETSALSRMCHLAVRGGRLDRLPAFPTRLEENPPRQGFFEHGEYLRVRAELPPSYQDVLDFAYDSGWRRNEILELTWDEIDRAGGVIRLPPQRSKTHTGRVLPISAPLRQVLDRRAGTRRAGDPRVFRRDGVTVRVWRHALRDACRRAGVPHRVLHDCRRTAARNLIRAGVPASPNKQPSASEPGLEATRALNSSSSTNA